MYKIIEDFIICNFYIIYIAFEKLDKIFVHLAISAFEIEQIKFTINSNITNYFKNYAVLTMNFKFTHL